MCLVWKMTLLLFVTLLLLSFASSKSPGDDDPCTELSQCMGDAAKKFEECQSLLEDKNDGESGPNEKSCRSQLRELAKQKQKVHEEKSQEFERCIERRLGLAEPDETGETRKCAKAERKFERKRARKAERQTAREKGKFGNRRRKGRMSEFRACKQEAKLVKDQCKILAACCSEGPICHLEYEQSETHDRIKALQLDLILKRRECRKEGGKHEFRFSDEFPVEQLVDADS